MFCFNLSRFIFNKKYINHKQFTIICFNVYLVINTRILFYILLAYMKILVHFVSSFYLRNFQCKAETFNEMVGWGSNYHPKKMFTICIHLTIRGKLLPKLDYY